MSLLNKGYPLNCFPHDFDFNHMKWQWWSEPSDLSNLSKGFEGNSNNNGITNQGPSLPNRTQNQELQFTHWANRATELCTLWEKSNWSKFWSRRCMPLSILHFHYLIKRHFYLIILLDGDSKMVWAKIIMPHLFLVSNYMQLEQT